MVRRRLKILFGDKVERLRADNPERVLLHDLEMGILRPTPADWVCAERYPTPSSPEWHIFED